MRSDYLFWLNSANPYNKYNRSTALDPSTAKTAVSPILGINHSYSNKFVPNTGDCGPKKDHLTL